MHIFRKLFWSLRYWLLNKRGVLFVILSPDKKILMQLRDHNSRRFKGYWCIPGGGAEEGEEPLDTLVREIREEYELTVRKEKCAHIYSRHFGTNRVYVCEPEPGQTPVMHEGADMKWMTLEEVEKLDLGYYQGEVLPALRSYLARH